MDQHKLRTLVFEKTGIKVDSNDPIFALVALNETVLAESVGVHIAAMNEATKKLAVHAKHLQEAGERYRNGQSGSADMERRNLTSDNSVPQQPVEKSGFRWQSIVGGAAIAFFSAALTLCGQWLLTKNNTVAFAAKPLSAEQISKIKTAEKFAKVLQNLDEQTRIRVQTEMQKR